MSYSRAKKQLFARVYGNSEAASYCEMKSKKGVKGISSRRDLLPIMLFSGSKKGI
jgi:hypothetical protein